MGNDVNLIGQRSDGNRPGKRVTWAVTEYFCVFVVRFASFSAARRGSGSAMVTPIPLRNVRRGKCFLLINIASSSYCNRRADSIGPLFKYHSQMSRPTRVRYAVLWLTVAVYMITYMDRVVISVATPKIREEFGFDLVTMGWILASFRWAYSIFQIPGGWLGGNCSCVSSTSAISALVPDSALPRHPWARLAVAHPT